jgi:hypothetical protein
MDTQQTGTQSHGALPPSEGPSAQEAYQIIWQQVEAEHTLINTRLGWYVTSQSFLLTAFGAWTLPNWEWVPALGIPILGVVTSVFTIFPILGASLTLNKWWRLRFTYVLKDSPLGRLIDLQRPRWIHPAALIVPNLFPVFFLALWVLIIRTR